MSFHDKVDFGIMSYPINSLFLLDKKNYLITDSILVSTFFFLFFIQD